MHIAMQSNPAMDNILKYWIVLSQVIKNYVIKVSKLKLNVPYRLKTLISNTIVVFT